MTLPDLTGPIVILTLALFFAAGYGVLSWIDARRRRPYPVPAELEQAIRGALAAEAERHERLADTGDWDADREDQP